MRRNFERLNAPTLFQDQLLAWILAALLALGAVVAASTWLAMEVPV
jgi:hypothetical protein